MKIKKFRRNKFKHEKTSNEAMNVITEIRTNDAEENIVERKKGIQYAAQLTSKIKSKLQRNSELKQQFLNPMKDDTNQEIGYTIKLRNRLGFKIAVVFIVCILICVATVGLSSYFLSKSRLESNIITASKETIKQVSRNMDTTLSKFEDMSIQLGLDDALRSNIQQYLSNDLFLKLSGEKSTKDLLSTYLYSNLQIRNIGIIPINKEVEPIFSGNISTNPTSIITNKEYQNTQWFQDVISNTKKVYWIESQEQGILETELPNTVAIARLVSNTEPGEEFIVVFEFLATDLFSVANDVEIVDNSYVEVINKINRYVKPEDMEQIGLEANFTLTDLSQTSDHLRSEHKETGNDYIVVYSQMQSNPDWYLIGALPEAEIKSEVRPIFIFTSIMIFIAALLAIIVGFFMLRMVSRPLMQISSVMTKGAKGDLTVRSPKMKNSDEIGVLANRFDEMMIQIEQLARQTTNSAQQVLTTAQELSHASQKTAAAGKEISIATEEIAAGSSALAIEAEKGTDLTHHITLQMEKVNQSREQMNQSATEVDESSERGLNYMTGLIVRTGETEQMVKQMVDKVNALSDSTKSIVQILDVLNSITKQTNILSLNAAIEAARAGQAGKGFMVVADEIRQLAEQSRQSIEVVGKITDTIFKEIVDTVEVLQQAQPIFQEQIVSVKEANEIFISVRSQMDSLKENIDEVSSAFDQLSETQETLVQSMNNVSSVAEQSSATSQEVASLSNEQLIISEQLVNLSAQLESVSTNLKAQLSRFTITNE